MSIREITPDTRVQLEDTLNRLEQDNRVKRIIPQPDVYNDDFRDAGFSYEIPGKGPVVVFRETRYVPGRGYDGAKAIDYVSGGR